MAYEILSLRRGPPTSLESVTGFWCLDRQCATGKNAYDDRRQARGRSVLILYSSLLCWRSSRFSFARVLPRFAAFSYQFLASDLSMATPHSPCSYRHPMLLMADALPALAASK